MAIPYNSEAIKNHDITGTQFQLGYLDASESAFLDKEFTKVELKGSGENYMPEIKIDLSGKHLEIVRLKLKGADNFGGFTFTFTDKQYPFGKRKVLDDKSLNAVKLYIPELAGEILKQSQLNEEQEKN